jgi:hypothetical protein
MREPNPTCPDCYGTGIYSYSDLTAENTYEKPCHCTKD